MPGATPANIGIGYQHLYCVVCRPHEGGACIFWKREKITLNGKIPLYAGLETGGGELKQFRISECGFRNKKGRPCVYI